MPIEINNSFLQILTSLLQQSPLNIHVNQIRMTEQLGNYSKYTYVCIDRICMIHRHGHLVNIVDITDYNEWKKRA